MLLNYAHRGASLYAPENTMAAFYLAQFNFADGNEIDVRKTKDGVLILFHDPTLFRITGDIRKVSDYTLVQLKQMDFGSYLDPKFKNEKIVTLEEYLSFFHDKYLSLQIELKESNLEENVIELLKKYPMKDVVIISFNINNLEKVKKLDPSINLGLLVYDFNEDTLETLKEKGINQINPKASYVTKEKVNDAHKLGIKVIAWDVNDLDVVQKLDRDNVDGVTTDNPALVNGYKMSKEAYNEE